MTRKTWPLLILPAACIFGITAQLQCPYERDKAAAGRVCHKACQPDGSCKKQNRECVCDGLCGPVCLKKCTQCLRNYQEVHSQNRKCKRRCESDSDCLHRRRCVCDDICGLSCIPIDRENYCKDLSSDESVRVRITPNNRTFGSIAQYECIKIYESAGGSNERRCLGSGQWSGDPLTCILKVPACPPLKTPRNGNMVINPSDRSIKAEVTYSCNDGYVLSGPKIRICQVNKRWSGTRPSCRWPDRGDYRPLCSLPIKEAIYRIKAQQRSSLQCDAAQRRELQEDKCNAPCLKVPEERGRIIVYSDNSENTKQHNSGLAVICRRPMACLGQNTSTCLNGTWFPPVAHCKENRAFSKPAYQDSTDFGGDANRAVDGSTDGHHSCSHTSRNGKNPWWYVDLGSSFFVQEIIIYNRQDDDHYRRLLNAKVRVGGLSGKNIYQNQVVGTVNDTRSYPIRIKVNPGVEGRFVSVSNLTNGNPLCLCEVQVLADQHGYSECGISGNTVSRGRIVGGNDANPGAWPWQVYLDIRKGYEQLSCGGVLIDRFWVLTTAHCLSNHPDFRITAVLGVTNLSEPRHQEIEVEEAIPHPVYEADRIPLTYQNDIALLKLRTSAELNDKVKIVCLPDKTRANRLIPPHPVWMHVGIITGWGSTKPRSVNDVSESQSSYQLQQLALPLKSREMCESSLEGDRELQFFDESMFCAGYDHAPHGACVGDGGDPLVKKAIRNSQRRWTLIGLTSWGRGCALSGELDFFTNVPYFMDWITETMQPQEEK